MAVISYKQLIIEELSLTNSTSDVNLVDTQWNRFGGFFPEEKQYLLAKRAVARSLMIKARKMVDTQIGFDQIKGSQLVSNFSKIIEDINEEIDSQYPEVKNDSDLISLSPELGMFFED